MTLARKHKPQNMKQIDRIPNPLPNNVVVVPADKIEMWVQDGRSLIIDRLWEASGAQCNIIAKMMKYRGEDDIVFLKKPTVLKYPVHFEVQKPTWFDGTLCLTSGGEFREATGPYAGRAKAFRSYRSAQKAAKKHNATVVAYWLWQGEYVYEHATIYGVPHELDNYRCLPDTVKELSPRFL